jgi:hypothetical protein
MNETSMKILMNENFNVDRIDEENVESINVLSSMV